MGLRGRIRRLEEATEREMITFELSMVSPSTTLVTLAVASWSFA